MPMTDPRIEAAARSIWMDMQDAGTEIAFENASIANRAMAISLARNALAAADAAAWRPIESAPKNGTPILASWQRSDGKKFVVRVYWDAEFSGETNEETEMYEWKGAWTDDSVASWGMEERHSYDPTHWMPLPNPPWGDAR